ncbi:MAG TPA: oxygenase MpaB family protein [Candidatus Binatia bacterium]|nr:oxygenase MpaB family protein [Candidatus Binatia bacterium]
MSRRGTLSDDDLTRLRAAVGRASIDPAASLFGPGSVTWRVNREAVLLLGGGRALLLQVAHPLVAAGVASYSRFRTEPLARLRRTLDLVLTIVFAEARNALGAVRDIERVHARVRGVLDRDVGPFRRGTPYSAGDPELLLWVHATLVDTALVAYERFVGPLAEEDRAAFQRESRVTARLLGVPDGLFPAGADGLGEYVAAMVASDALAIGPDGRAIADSILRPPLATALRPLGALGRFVTVGLLPAPLRARYGLQWSDGRDTVLSALALLLRRIVPRLPHCVRDMPHARSATARVRRRRADPLSGRAAVW